MSKLRHVINMTLFLFAVWLVLSGHYTALLLGLGALSVLFVVLLRRILIEESGLPFPESVACGEIHKAGQKGGSEARLVFQSGLVGAFILALGEFSIMKTGWNWFIRFGQSSVTFITEKTKEIFDIPLFNEDGTFKEKGGATKPTVQDADLTNYQMVTIPGSLDIWIKIPVPAMQTDWRHVDLKKLFID